MTSHFRFKVKNGFVDRSTLQLISNFFWNSFYASQFSRSIEAMGCTEFSIKTSNRKKNYCGSIQQTQFYQRFIAHVRMYLV